MSTLTDHKHIVRSFLEALVRDDKATMRPLVRDDVIWWLPPSAEGVGGMTRPLTGWDRIVWLGGGGPWPGFRPGSSSVVIHHLVAEDDMVAAHYNRRAVRPGGTPFDNEYHLLFRLADSRIAEVWEVTDTAYAAATREG